MPDEASALFHKMDLEIAISQIYSGHADAIYALEPGMSESDLFSGSGDGFIGRWDLATGTFAEPLAKMPATIYSLRLTAPNSVLYAGLQNGMLFALNVRDRSIAKSLQLSTQGIFDLALLEDGRYLLAASGEGFVYLLNTQDHQLVQSLNLTNKSIRSLGISPCGKFIVAGSSDHKIYFLKMEDRLILQQVIEAHDNSVFSAVYKEGYQLLSGGRDALLKQWNWDLDQQAWQANKSLPAHNFTINTIRLNPSRALFATGSRDKTIKIWASESLQLLKVIDLEKFPASHTHSVNTLCWLDDQTLLSAGDDKRIIRWTILPRNKS